MNSSTALELLRSYYDIGGWNLMGKGILTKMQSALGQYPDTIGSEEMDIQFNWRHYTVSTEYPGAERWVKYERGVAEPGAKRIIDERLSSGSVFVDIGAQCGDTALYVHSIVGSEGSIHAFEPTTYWCSILRENIRRNEIENAVARNEAVGKQTDELSPEAVVGGRHELMNDTFEQETVNVVCLEDYIESEGLEPDLIQIDVDGAEYDVLQGAKEYLGTVPVILELHHQKILDAWEATVEMIIDHCNVYYLDEQGLFPSQYPFGTEIGHLSQLRSDRVSYLLLD